MQVVNHIMTNIQLKNPAEFLEISDKAPDFKEINKQTFKLSRLVKALIWKSGLPDDFPLIVSLIGGTGTGKSSIFNSLAGKVVSKTAAIRPCTKLPLAMAPPKWAYTLEKCPVLEMGLDVESKSSGDKVIEMVDNVHVNLDEWILVDTPDYDSAESAHVASAHNVFVISDIVILVTSKDKYADMATVQMERWAKDWKKRTVRVLNMVQDTQVVADYEEKFKEKVAALDYEPGMPNILAQISKKEHGRELLQLPKDQELQSEIRNRELENLARQATLAVDDLQKPLKVHEQRVDYLEREIDRTVEETAREVFDKSEHIFTKDLQDRAKLQLSRALRRYDFLYGPRKRVSDLMGAALTKASMGLVGWRGSSIDKKREEIEAEFRRSWNEAHSKPVVIALDKFNLRVAELLSKDKGLDHIRRIAGEQVKKLGESEIQDHMEDVISKVDTVLKEELAGFEKGLSTKEEITLYGSYTLSAMALLTAEVAVGGGLGALDLILTSAVAPFIPKVALNVKVYNLMKELGEKVDAVYKDGLREMLNKQAELYKDSFKEFSVGPDKLKDLENLKNELKLLSSAQSRAMG